MGLELLLIDNDKTVMNIYKNLFSEKSMKGKILRIKDDIEKLIKPICNEKFWVEWYGAYDIDPKNLVFWGCVQTDETKERFESNSDLMNNFRLLLDKYDYPEQARKHVHIGFESQETVDRESDGDWYLHFK
ncbi:hypothetical protein FNH22_24060 [Fulvivirga sp. M361]|uniref:hypothetical protein n=1 Tax=Fulvivirga sp. M361 TaxID=2594266 RepID=UPI00117B5253|nr:hypothetical protein [Fulvivirga sp. M361]TRX51639.1 hypothetical protein FNH22_24060 [Fulvivirga sp. M361]